MRVRVAERLRAHGPPPLGRVAISIWALADVRNGNVDDIDDVAADIAESIAYAEAPRWDKVVAPTACMASPCPCGLLCVELRKGEAKAIARTMSADRRALCK